jgi:tRNA(Ile2) C34 agmatinyltransferase TiaS
MAKKAPTKVCPKCGKTNHARSIKCKFCHTTIPVKAKTSMPKKTSRSMSEVLNAAIRLVKAAGSFEKAKAILNELEAIKKL